MNIFNDVSRSFVFSFLCFTVVCLFAFQHTLNALYAIFFQLVFWFFYLDLKRKLEAEEDSEYESD